MASRGAWVEWRGKLVPSELLEHLRSDELCPECGGLGSFPEQIDVDHFPVMVPCQRCRRYCETCKKHVKKEGHEHA
jgi:hypothetical protein